MKVSLLIPFLFLASSVAEKKEAQCFVKDTLISNAASMIKDGEHLVKNGDIVMRNNNAITSSFIRNFNRLDKSYSHVGIVFIENGYPFVYHMIPGEENPEGAMKRDSLKNFCDGTTNSAYGIYRYDLNSRELQRLKLQVLYWYTQQIKFDGQFSLSTDSVMYCSEMVKKAVERATKNRIKISLTKPGWIEAQVFAREAHIPIDAAKNLKLVALDDLYLNAHCQVVKRFKFFQ